MEFDKWIEKSGNRYGKQNAGHELALRDAFNAGVAAEREACAEICDNLKSMDYCVDVRQAADAIRKRSNVKLTG